MEKNVFIEKIESFIKKEHLFKLDCRYLAAVSGGADSVVMLRTLLLLGIKCEVAHCNFHLRGKESDRDEHFVTELCNNLGIKCHKIDFHVSEYERQRHISTEMACRELRYNWFAQIVKSNSLSGVVVAHHSDDNIETLFLNILRGTGISGLAGIQPVSHNNVTILRPMLSVTRSEIEDYASEIGQDFITDSTNHEIIVKRNKLRNAILPLLREYFPDANAGILHTINNMRECGRLYRLCIDDIRNKYITVTSSNITKIHLNKFLNRYLDAGCAETVIFELLKPFGYNSVQAENIVETYRNGNRLSGKEFLSAEYVAALNRESLDIAPSAIIADTATEYPITLSEQCICTPISISTVHIFNTKFSPIGIDGKFTACFSSDILSASLKLRHWREGDRFCPFGMKGSRLVSDIFSDLKLSTIEKRLVWLMTANDEIVWIIGVRTSSHFSVSKSATEFVKLTIK